jgi:hypothetical protein
MSERVGSIRINNVQETVGDISEQQVILGRGSQPLAAEVRAVDHQVVKLSDLGMNPGCGHVDTLLLLLLVWMLFGHCRWLQHFTG